MPSTANISDKCWKFNGAHRGGFERAENTLPTFQNAIEQGLNLMECDVLMTKDEQVICCHDEEMSRLCGDEYAGEYFKDYNYDELPPMLPKYIKANESGLFTLLRDLFAITDGVYVSIQTKSESQKLVEKVDSLIKEFNREDMTIWGSHHTQWGEALYEQNKNVSLFFGYWMILRTYFWWAFGCMWMCPFPADVFMT